MSNCDCQSVFQVKLARPEDYWLFKSILNKGRHPAFIGRSTMQRNALNGGALFYKLKDEIVAVSLINPHHGILLCLNVLPIHRGHGLGQAIMKFLIPNFSRVLEARVSFFESLGYKKIGSLKKGRSLNTQLMARSALFDLAGNLNKAWKEDYE